MKTHLRAMVIVTALMVVPALLAYSQETRSLTQQGDDLYEQRGDLAKAKEALAKYQDALLKDENAYEVYWRLSRVEYWIGDHTASKDEKIKIFGLGIYHANKAVALEPNRPEGHYWLGVNDGVYGEAKGILRSLSLVKPIKAAMNRVLAIDPKYDDGGADRVLGRVYFEVPGFFGGDKKKSLEHLLKSKEMGPRVGLTRIYLADTYLALKDVAKAREELQFVIDMEPDPKLLPETAEEKIMARDRLKSKEFQIK